VRDRSSVTASGSAWMVARKQYSPARLPLWPDCSISKIKAKPEWPSNALT
jgi:hypothetical protein